MAYNQRMKENNSSHKDLPVLALMTIVLFAIKAVWAVLISTGPLIHDELLYKFNANALFTFQKYYTAHYPPIYPLTLAPAFFFKNWYEAMLVLNAFWSSLLVPASWLLARTAGVRYPLLAAALTAIIPMQVVYPNTLFSENLFVPLFVLATALALRGGKRGNVEALAFGFVLGITHLTKYLFLPALLLLFGAWLYSRSKNMTNTKSESLFRWCVPAFLVLASYAVIVGSWLIYGFANGFYSRQLFGLGISGGIAQTATGGSLLMWVAAYSSYVILAWLPAWCIVSIWISQLADNLSRVQLEPKNWRFLVLVSLLLACYWLVAVQHSFGAGYNYPIPQYIIGRYLMHLSPIMLIVAVWILERIAESKLPFRPVRALISIGILVCCVSAAWWILIYKGIWASSHWNIGHVINSVDVTAFVSPWTYLSAIVMLLLILIITWLQSDNIQILVLPIVAFMLVSLVVDAERVHARQNGLHYRHMAFVASNLNEQGDTLNIFTDNRDLSLLLSEHFRGRDWARRLNQQRLEFWGVKLKQILIYDFSTRVGFQVTSVKSPALLITNTLIDIRPEREYLVNGKTYYIYRVDGHDPNMLQPVIKDVK